MNLRSLNSSSMQGASFDREIASGFARKAISQDGEAVRSDSSAVAVDDAQVARTTSAPVVLRELNEKSGPVFKIAADPRITRVGKWLRKLSLDEFPQLINVLRSDIPLRILKTRPEFSEKSMGAFALPAKSSTNKEKAFSQVVSCFASGLRMRRISGFNCNCISGMETQFLAKPVFGAVCA